MLDAHGASLVSASSLPCQREDHQESEASRTSVTRLDPAESQAVGPEGELAAVE